MAERAATEASVAEAEFHRTDMLARESSSIGARDTGDISIESYDIGGTMSAVAATAVAGARESTQEVGGEVILPAI